MSIKNLQAQSFAACSSCLFLPTTAKHFDWAGLYDYLHVCCKWQVWKKIVVINFVKIFINVL